MARKRMACQRNVRFRRNRRHGRPKAPLQFRVPDAPLCCRCGKDEQEPPLLLLGRLVSDGFCATCRNVNGPELAAALRATR